MPSPFPGMNPYLEQDTVWLDFHERFCAVVAELLTSQVRPYYIVKIDEQVYIHELPAESRNLLGRGDVAVIRPSLLARHPLRRSWWRPPRFYYLSSMLNASPVWKSATGETGKS